MISRIPKSTLLALGLIAVVAIALGLSIGRSDASPSSGDAPQFGHQVAAAKALTTKPVVAPSPSSPTHQTEAGLRSAGAQLESDVPLPPGGSFDRIDWAAAASQGGDSEAGMRSVIEYQAACQWYSYALANDAPDGALTVIDTISDWPTFRANPTNAGATATAMAEAFKTGKLDTVKSFIATNCR